MARQNQRRAIIAGAPLRRSARLQKLRDNAPHLPSPSDSQSRDLSLKKRRHDTIGDRKGSTQPQQCPSKDQRRDTVGEEEESNQSQHVFTSEDKTLDKTDADRLEPPRKSAVACREAGDIVAVGEKANTNQLGSLRELGEEAERSGQEQISSAFRGERIAFWATTGNWPPLYHMAGAMNSQDSLKRNNSMTESDPIKRLEANNVILNPFLNNGELQDDSKDLCKDLRSGDKRPTQVPWYPLSDFRLILGRLADYNEARLVRDLLPITIPSPEHLAFSGQVKDYLGEELSADWTQCQLMGGETPRPHITVGFRNTAFTRGELEKLEYYSSLGNSFYTTQNTWFPFLVGEVNRNETGIARADRRNAHNSAIAVRNILRLFIQAYGKTSTETKGLLGSIRVFLITHDLSALEIYGHYPLLEKDSGDRHADQQVEKDGDNSHGEQSSHDNTEDAVDTGEGNPSIENEPIDEKNIKYYRTYLGSAVLPDDEQRYISYNFVLNLYEQFAPNHLKQIKKAISKLASVKDKGLPFDASNLDTNESPQIGQSTVQYNRVFKVPDEAASTRSSRGQNKEQNKPVQLYEQQLREYRNQMKALQQQMEKQQKVVEQLTTALANK